MLLSMSVASSDSNWNTPAVRPARSCRYVSGSSSGSTSRSGRVPDVASMSPSASWMIVSVVRPRKSILSIPVFSSAFMSYCVTTIDSSSREPPEPLELCVHTGTYSSSGPGAMTMPAACTPAWRESPSSAIA